MLKYGLSRGDALSHPKKNQNLNENLKSKSLDYKVWKIKHRLIADSINATGRFELVKITQQAKELAEMAE